MQHMEVSPVEDLRMMHDDRRHAPCKNLAFLLTIFGHIAAGSRLIPYQDQIKVQEELTTPNFDLRRLGPRLLQGTRKERVQLLRAVHIRFWHASVQDMEMMLSRLLLPDSVMQLIALVVSLCPDCRRWMRSLNLPRFGLISFSFYSMPLCFS